MAWEWECAADRVLSDVIERFSPAEEKDAVLDARHLPKIHHPAEYVKRLRGAAGRAEAVLVWAQERVEGVDEPLRNHAHNDLEESRQNGE